ncbi:aminotransferase class V-fold PLP-dependent enzyme [Salipaludibacillus agaradhaerens]|uniref:cysteine desulfurase n=1 Tax=Salipaludibacillus agaradhaerens TaxID=76935 RepID=A0A9Q4G0Y8_SALAG|nr:aminotransferase class V-fold PLP-dependent enzyme [Salipaludibacillus agaradhaerens]MCR6098492.1 aminotransferase class V-fold PLP-dependent enzyme [Salipaludibacillus agaradhaerens]MCR6115878.1 aminotransferase class V-fold PLP-dependent enzyme [Salipaludibacillus agaradhaerens]
MIYFDQAASSFPKPVGVAEAMVEAVQLFAANPGRSGHQLARQANEVVEKTRKKLALLFHHESERHIVFSLNATTALNQAIEGLMWEPHDHIIATQLEHNAVRRPLERLKKEKNIHVTYVQKDSGQEWAELIEATMTEHTKLVIVTHGSNVTGEILPLKEISEVVSEHNALLCVDASQTAGIVDINMATMGIDMLAFPGHKGLMGPQGTGVLMVKKHVALRPLIVGGTGDASESPEQPETWPERLESGTINTPGIAGLLKGIETIHDMGIKTIYEHEKKLAIRCIDGLNAIGGIEIVGPDTHQERLGVVSFLVKGVDPHEMAIILDNHYHVAVRAGLHCSPLAHQVCGSSETGLVRASFGLYNTLDEVDTFLSAVAEIKEGLLE